MSNTNKVMALNAIKNILTLAERIELARASTMGMGKYLTSLINHLQKFPNDARAIEHLVEDETLNLCAATMAASEDMLKEAKKTLMMVTNLLLTNMKEPDRGQINLN
jgi:hypothetical protein